MNAAGKSSPLGRRVWICLLILAVLFYAGFSWRNRDVNRISRRLEKLRSLLTKAADEPPLLSISRAREITTYFAPQATVSLGSHLPDFLDRQELVAAAHRARAAVHEMSVKIRDKTIRLGPDRNTATVDLTAEGTVSYRGESDRVVRSFRLEWVKQEGNWLIARAEPLEIIRSPARALPPR